MYNELVQWVKKGFVKVCEGELSISHQLSKNNIVFCIDSSVIYESLWHGCKTFLFKGAHLRFLERIVRSGYINLISSSYQIKKSELIHDVLTPKGFFFDDVRIDVLKQLFTDEITYK